MSAIWASGKVSSEASYKSAAVIQTDVLIIGAGLAGLSTALALPKSLNITVLSKAALEVCSSHYAQGGIAACLDKDDSITDHIADTLVAGAGLCTTDNTSSILSAGQQAIQWLCEQGVPFTQTPKENKDQNHSAKPFTELQTADLHLTKEGGHGCRRIAHADDATGRHVMEALTVKVKAASNITVLAFHEALQLLTSSPIDSQFLNNTFLNSAFLKNTFLNNTKIKHCQGAIVFDHSSQRQITFHSRAVVLASGGLGKLFQRASAPNVCVGDGVMMAWQAGCRLANLEFIQFHPTGLALGDSSFLISEALRGEGGKLYCPKTGERFMLDIDARAELAPRDIVARAIAEQINNNGLGYVNLDVSHLPAEFLREHFPQIYQTLLNLGIDMTREPIPVAPTAHYSCGGVVTDANGVTDVAGLYAAGEVAYTGLHGANRLASNSLLECVVVGRNIATELPRYLTAMEKLATTSYVNNVEQPATIDRWTPPILKETQPISLSAASLPVLDTYQHNELKNESNADNELIEITAQLKVLMTNNMGISRSAKQLEQALIKIEQWQQQITRYKTNPSDISSADNFTSSNQLASLQLARQLQLATLIVQSASQRLESRGGHYRTDYPNLALTPKTSIIEPLSNVQEDSIAWLVKPIIKHTEARTAQAVANI